LLGVIWNYIWMHGHTNVKSNFQSPVSLIP